MAFKSACFISYPHNAGKSVDAFVTRLKIELQDRFAQFVSDPIVTDHDFETGADFHRKIAQSICESACLLVVYMPVYQRKPFCIQEYTAMQQLQVKRYGALGPSSPTPIGMILPLVYTGQAKIPKWISDEINYKDISQFTISDPLAVFDRDDFKQWLVQIANLVDSLYNMFQGASPSPCQTCGVYALPAETDPDVTTKLNVPTAPPESFRCSIRRLRSHRCPRPTGKSSPSTPTRVERDAPWRSPIRPACWRGKDQVNGPLAS
jgi:hypothetical protein